jgi:hypothetical protein
MSATDILWYNLPALIVAYSLAAVGIWLKLRERRDK